MTSIQEIDLTPALGEDLMPSLCFSTDQELLARLDQAKSRADIVEIDLILDEIERRALSFPQIN
ncbi:MAG: hypothetical protein LBH73_07120 [Spirochaetaceae bacterium]|jgi:hypothetical protein|nr:hypothetical protein [Spirochaetaceae bacterium]